MIGVQCVSCKSFSLKRVPASEARQGLGHCEHRELFIRHHAMAERDCLKFDQEGADVVKARLEWIGRRHAA